MHISEVGLNCMQEQFLGKEKVTLLGRCPHFRGVLREVSTTKSIFTVILKIFSGVVVYPIYWNVWGSFPSRGVYMVY